MWARGAVVTAYHCFLVSYDIYHWDIGINAFWCDTYHYGGASFASRCIRQLSSRTMPEGIESHIYTAIGDLLYFFGCFFRTRVYDIRGSEFV